MTEKDIRPIPKYILRKIEREDARQYRAPEKQVRFYAYLMIRHKELIKVTVAVKHYRKKRYCKAVAWHGIHSGKCFVKDLEYNYFGGMGYRVGWFDEGIQKEQRWYERGLCRGHDRHYDPWAPIVNSEVVDKLPEYQYSAYKLFQGVNLFKYLRLYERFPQLEMLMKSGLGNYYDSVTILKRIGKDKAFCKWLIRNREELTGRWNGYYVETIMQSYKKGKPLKEIQSFLSRKKSLSKVSDFKPLFAMFKGQRLETLFRYLDEKNISPRQYLDYLKACEYLHLDMSQEKNSFPHEFRRWHDIRIDQYATAKAEADKAMKQALYDRFASVAKKYLPLEHAKRSAFICIIARSPADLVREGEILHHCVGRMNYDQRFAREESLIFFIRTKTEPNVPLVTVEYSLKLRKVLQCYGDHDQRPNDDVLHYINKVWLPYANKTIKAISAA